MGEMITKPETNPIVAALLNFLLFGSVGYFYIGQSRKGVMTLVAFLVGSFCTCGLLSFVVAIASTVDVYGLAQKLAEGQSIGENENSLALLDSVFKD